MFFIPFIALMQFYFLPTVEENIVSDKKEALKISTQLVISIISHLEKKVESGALTREAAQNQARERLRVCDTIKASIFGFMG